MKTQIIETKTIWTKNPNTKTTYVKELEEVKELTEKEHHNITSPDTLRWFRRLGGSETAVMGYTCAGYLCTKLTSTSPDRKTKYVRSFEFKTP